MSESELVRKRLNRANCWLPSMFVLAQENEVISVLREFVVLSTAGISSHYRAVAQCVAHSLLSCYMCSLQTVKDYKSVTLGGMCSLL